MILAIKGFKIENIIWLINPWKYHNPDYFSRLPRSFSGPSHPNNQGFVVSEICFTYKIWN